MGANKVALGHHRDDIIETLFLNMFHGGRLKAMPPKLLTDDGQHVVIRPLAYCREKELASFARHMNFPIIPCDLCGSQENLQRQAIKNWLQEEERQHPGRLDNIFQSLQSVTPSHLADTTLFDFDGLAAHTDSLSKETGALRLSHQDTHRIQFSRAGQDTTALPREDAIDKSANM